MAGGRSRARADGAVLLMQRGGCLPDLHAGVWIDLGMQSGCLHCDDAASCVLFDDLVHLKLRGMTAIRFFTPCIGLMAHVHFVQADGLPRQAAMELAVKGRRRLSAIMRQHQLDTGRTEPMYVSVTRADRLQRFELNAFVDAISKPDAELQVLRRDWSKTLVGPRDVITITYLPLGGGGSSGGRGGSGKSGIAIGASIAAIALAVIAPFAIPFYRRRACYRRPGQHGGDDRC